jgi:predicted dehydrogenase
MTPGEAEEILAAGRAAGVLVMEAMWTRYLPQSSILRQVIADGIIGDVRLVTADFGFANDVDPAHRLWDPALGGGALLDAGVYPISFASSVLGPLELRSVAGTVTNGVDSSAALSVAGRNGTDALLATSLLAMLPVEAHVSGSLGRARILSPFFGPTGIEVTLGGPGSDDVTTWRDERFEAIHDGLSDQATAFASYVAEGRTESPIHPHDEVVQVMRIIDEARTAILRG